MANTLVVEGLARDIDARSVDTVFRVFGPSRISFPPENKGWALVVFDSRNKAAEAKSLTSMRMDLVRRNLGAKATITTGTRKELRRLSGGGYRGKNYVGYEHLGGGLGGPCVYYDVIGPRAPTHKEADASDMGKYKSCTATAPNSYADIADAPKCDFHPFGIHHNLHEGSRKECKEWCVERVDCPDNANEFEQVQCQDELWKCLDELRSRAVGLPFLRDRK
jgi:hypothetical protein